MYNIILAVIGVIEQALRKSQRKPLAAIVEGWPARSKYPLAAIAILPASIWGLTIFGSSTGYTCPRQ